MANSEDMSTPPVYYALPPSGTQKPTEPVSTLSRVKRLNRLGSLQTVAMKLHSATQLQEHTGSLLKKRKTNPELLFLESPNHFAVIMQR